MKISAGESQTNVGYYDWLTVETDDGFGDALCGLNTGKTDGHYQHGDFAHWRATLSIPLATQLLQAENDLNAKIDRYARGVNQIIDGFGGDA